MVHYYISLATAIIAPMSQPNRNTSPTPDQTGTSGFSAQSQMGLPEVLQMCCLSRRSGQITFRSGESYGFIYIQHGRVLHALCGTTEGEEAIYSMLLWPGGGFSLDEDILPHKKTIALTWEQLLFEGARRADRGLNEAKSSSPTITAAEPLSVRIHESQPKLTITRPDLPEANLQARGGIHACRPLLEQRDPAPLPVHLQPAWYLRAERARRCPARSQFVQWHLRERRDHQRNCFAPRRSYPDGDRHHQIRARSQAPQVDRSRHAATRERAGACSRRRALARSITRR